MACVEILDTDQAYPTQPTNYAISGILSKPVLYVSLSRVIWICLNTTKPDYSFIN
jgi:hypothetical protein